jgi:hypothetical protein
MNIENPELIRFSNEKGRICADSLLQAYNTAKQFLSHWDNLNSEMPNTNDEVADGSHTSMGNSADGRKPITGEKYHQFKSSCESIIALVEANGEEFKNILLNISVNGQARF